MIENNSKLDEELLLPVPSESSEKLRSKVWIESKKLWRIAFPAIVASLTSFGLSVVTQAFIGHISELDLAAYALTQTLTLRFANGVLLGMSSATETMCGQAFGAKQYPMLGVYLQKSWIINLIVATLLLPLFIYTPEIYKLLGQEDDISIEAGKFSLWFIPTLYSYAFNFSLQLFLQAQLKNTIVMWLSILSFVIHVLLSWLFVIKLDWGIPGAMIVLSLSPWLLILGEVYYVFGGWCLKTWTGFTRAAFNDLLPFMKLSISSGIMVCLELWYNSVLVLMAGYMQNAVVSISALSICLNVTGWQFMIPLGLLIGTSVRVSNELGKGDAKAVKFAIKTVICTSAIIGVFFWISCIIFGKKIAYLFTSEQEIVDAVSSLSPLLAFTVLFNCVQPILLGVAIGAGRQSMVTYINIGCYYAIGVPLGLLLAYVANLYVEGLWMGMIIGVATQTVLLGYFTWRLDWDHEVTRAFESVNKWLLKPSNESSNDQN